LIESSFALALGAYTPLHTMQVGLGEDCPGKVGIGKAGMGKVGLGEIVVLVLLPVCSSSKRRCRAGTCYWPGTGTDDAPTASTPLITSNEGTAETTGDRRFGSYD
jgi:hypothetical protein